MAETFSVELPEESTFSVPLEEAKSADSFLAAPAEAALRVGTGMLGFPIGLGAGAMGMMLPGERGQGQRYMERAQELTTYQPQTEGGIMLSDIVTKPFQWLGQAARWSGEKVADVTGSPTLAAITDATVQMAPSLVAMAAKPALAKYKTGKMAKVAAEAERSKTIEAAQAAGYVMPPPSTAGRALSSIGGKEVLRQDMAWHNQQVTNAIARQEAGLPPNAPISVDALQQARTVIEQPYREVARTSPTAAAALEELKAARASGQAWWKRYGVSKHPDDLAKAKQYGVEERFWDTMIDQEAIKVGRPELLGQLKAARVASAKNRTVERALNPSTGDVSARVIGQIFAKQKGEGMTGGLETIGRFANGPGWEVTRDVSRVGIPGGQHGQAVESVAGGIIGGIHGGPAGMMAGAGIPLARIPARALALSRLLQPRPRYTPGLSFSLADLVTRRPEIAALTPGLGTGPTTKPEVPERPPWAMQWPEER